MYGKIDAIHRTIHGKNWSERRYSIVVVLFIIGNILTINANIAVGIINFYVILF